MVRVVMKAGMVKKVAVVATVGLTITIGKVRTS